MRALAGIVSVGARTSVGLNAPQTCFLHRAGIAGMTEAALLDANDEPLTMCLQPTLDPLLVGPDRAVALAMPALTEALLPLSALFGSLRAKLVVCLDEHLAVRGADGWVAASSVMSALSSGMREQGVAPVAQEACARGPAALAFTIGDELAALANGTLDAVVVGGLHTDYDPPRLRALAAQERLYSPENLDAIMPGEAAAFAVLMRPDTARRCGLPVLGELNGLGTAFEKARPDNDEPAFEALGLTMALRKVGEILIAEKQKAGWVLTDLTFEMMRLNEWMSVWTRAASLLGEPNHVDSPAQRMGHFGAAAMPMHLVLAAEAWRRGYAPSKIALSFAGSDAGERAAMLLSDPNLA
jgi:3-oxoacyl-[acyl-carrier-protein] synthase-1